MDDKQKIILGNLFKSLCDNASRHGLVVTNIQQHSDTFLKNFIQKNEVQEDILFFLKKINSYLYPIQEQKISLEDQKIEQIAHQEKNKQESIMDILQYMALQSEPPPPVRLITNTGTLNTEPIEVKKYEMELFDDTKNTEPLIIERKESTATEETSVALYETCLQQNSVETLPPINKSQKNSEQQITTFSINSNGKVNIPYYGKIESRNANGQKIIINDVIIPQEIGDLQVDLSSGIVQGIPLIPGEFKLKIKFQFNNPKSSSPNLYGECRLIIIPDPKTLWKNIPSDNNDPYWKKDEDSFAIKGNDSLNMVVASKRGRSHAHIGSFRDDDACITHHEKSGWRIITVADGAGSAKESRKGSFIASQITSNYILQELISERGENIDNIFADWENDVNATKLIQSELYYLFGNAVKEAVSAIEVESKKIGANYKDFSTTLLMLIHKKISIGHIVAAYWVGDGGIGVYRRGEEVKILGKADSGEFAGQTKFLDSSILDSQEIINRIKMTIVPDFTAIIAMTDGITDPWFETDANFEAVEKWETVWTELERKVYSSEPDKNILEWLDFWSPGNHDDRTIALIYPDLEVTE